MSTAINRLRNIEKRINSGRHSTIVLAEEHNGELYVDGKKWIKPDNWDDKKCLLIVITREKYPHEV